ncbi:ASCH domain-containing protein [Klebsiella variicola]|uniref:hypothetical protein n=1 Tax=Klebsiella variicola TaxID=244366 RepID=UPI000C7CF588|nr:hypothetical protein [Klebsiella variicola]PLC78292.1 hypothetical protein B6I40_09565 [Klebsiella variicola]
MKERRMIFNGEMVRAILDGRKTQTRREVKLNLDIASLATTYDWATSLAANHYQGLTEEQIQQKAESLRGVIHPVILGNGQMVSIICPHGKPGDRIWVRETFAALEPGSYEQVKPQEGHCQDLRYAATDRLAKSDADIRGYKWVPSIHMPRWASRILLEITDVRVERLNAISQEDAQAEGMELTGWRPTYSDPDSGGEASTPYDNFAQLWESIYGEESWKANGWVWVIEFKRVEGGAA